MDAGADGTTDSRASPFYGAINPFYGVINPFYGLLNPFYGQISPFWGDITPFWGTINPFYGTISPFYGDINPFWGNISPFYGNINPFWGTIQPFWQDAGPVWGNLDASWTQLQASGATDYSGLRTQLQAFIDRSQNFWGTAVQKATNSNFMDGFASKLLSQYGINLNDASSLAKVTPEARSAFFLAWYDGLMSFTGVDHVDWWMAAVHWTPLLTQIQAAPGPAGHNLIVGLLDFAPSKLDDSIQHLKLVGGYKGVDNGHGAAVASLISAQHDGQGIMGIAPNATVDLYNPFDSTGTASWSDVQQGVATLYAKGARVINMSLGIPGWTLSTEWAKVTASSAFDGHKIVFVKAAGNEGVMQTSDIPWSGSQVPDNLIIVGSVGPSGTISSFSNTPGEACILVNATCSEENKLKYRFVVAPGELILVSDNNGGVTRLTGTSFAAPLVTGAVALLQTRWPWLQDHAKETVQIILRSARDLGAPGVDPVYGWGMLDVEASQSPLNFNNLVVYQPAYRYDTNFKTADGMTWTAANLKTAILSSGQLNLWQQQKAFIVAFETIGDTYRDFAIPLSSALIGKTLTINGFENPFQSYLYQRMIDWAGGSGFSDVNTRSAQLSEGDWELSMVATTTSPTGVRRGEGPFHSEFVAANRASGTVLRMGEGSGARALAGQSAFSLNSDFDPSTGGVNPVLGFASGGAYVGGAVTIGERMHLSVGFSQQSDNHTLIDPANGVLRNLPLSPYEAVASVIGIDYGIADGITLNASYTRLNEASGLLGGQGSGVLGLSGGSRTDALTWGATAALPDGIELMASATFAHTNATHFEHSALGISDGGLTSTAYEIAALKRGIFGRFDQLRFSFAQPLHVESGALEYQSLQVVDRNTGELGGVTQKWDLAGGREYRAEAIYTAPVLDGRAEVSGFALLDLNPPALSAKSQILTVGAQIRFGL